MAFPTATLLPDTADRSNVFVKAFAYDSPQQEFVVPLSGSAGSGIAGLGSGQATLVAGTVAVADAAIKSTSRVIYSRKTIGGTPGNNSVVITDGVGFTFSSSSGTDTSVLDYLIIY
jgi:hypothetical protein